MINSTSFGHVTVNGKDYPHDIWLFADGTIKRRDTDHDFSGKEFEMISKGADTVVVATGQSGVCRVSGEAKQLAQEKGVKLIIEETPEAIETFNKIEGKKAIAVHVTC